MTLLYFWFTVSLAVLPAVTVAQSLQVNTPASVVGCEPSQIQWTGGVPPYFLSFVPAGQPGAPALKQFPSQSGNSITWNTDLPVGTLFTITLRDGTGAVAFSDKVAVQSGPESSCVGTVSGGSDTTSTGNGTANPGNAGGNTTGSTTGGAASPPLATNGGAPAAQLPPVPHATSGTPTNDPSKIQSNNAVALGGSHALLIVHLMSLISGVLLF